MGMNRGFKKNPTNPHVELPWGHDPEPMPAVAHLRQELGAKKVEIPWKFLQFSPKESFFFWFFIFVWSSLNLFSIFLNSLNLKELRTFDPQTRRGYHFFSAVVAGWWGECITLHNIAWHPRPFKLGRMITKIRFRVGHETIDACSAGLEFVFCFKYDEIHIPTLCGRKDP